MKIIICGSFFLLNGIFWLDINKIKVFDYIFYFLFSIIV